MNNNEFCISEAIEVINEILDSGGEFTLSPKGISMLPFIKEGRDTLTVKRDVNRQIKKNDIIFYKRNDDSYVIHRVKKVCPDETYVLNGDNQLFLEYGIKDEQIIGYVSEIKRNGVPMMHKLRYKLYVFFWSNLPLRKVLFFIRAVFSRLKNKGNKNDNV